MSDDSLLPPNATPVERGFEAAGARITALPVPVRDTWNPATCPATLLPWLAWALSVDNWDPTWTEGQQRAVIAASVAVHRRKGTVAAVREALAAAGYGDASLIEEFGAHDFDGTYQHDGTITYEGRGHWAEYRVVMARPLSNAQADMVRAILAQVAPARCHLDRLDFAEAAHLYDGAITYDGTFNHGAA
jgi:phage tail P2-like protein